MPWGKHGAASVQQKCIAAWKAWRSNTRSALVGLASHFQHRSTVIGSAPRDSSSPQRTYCEKNIWCQQHLVAGIHPCGSGAIAINATLSETCEICHIATGLHSLSAREAMSFMAIDCTGSLQQRRNRLQELHGQVVSTIRSDCASVLKDD